MTGIPLCHLGNTVALGALGYVLWLRRRRTRHLEQALAEVRSMLKDRINNKLQVVMAHLEPGPSDDHERLREVTTAVYAVAEILHELNPAAVRAWRAGR